MLLSIAAFAPALQEYTEYLKEVHGKGKKAGKVEAMDKRRRRRRRTTAWPCGARGSAAWSCLSQGWGAAGWQLQRCSAGFFV